MYVYQTEKPAIFTEEGQETFLEIRDKVQRMLKQNGVVMLENIIHGISGDTWMQMACVDRLVELKEIKEIKQDNILSQHRIFVSVL